MIDKKNKLDRLKQSGGKTTNISITVKEKYLKIAKKILKGNDLSISSMFNMFLEDFVYEQLSEPERNNISKAELKDFGKLCGEELKKMEDKIIKEN